jgi:hypothetical protein
MVMHRTVKSWNVTEVTTKEAQRAGALACPIRELTGWNSDCIMAIGAANALQYDTVWTRFGGSRGALVLLCCTWPGQQRY